MLEKTGVRRQGCEAVDSRLRGNDPVVMESQARGPWRIWASLRPAATLHGLTGCRKTSPQAVILIPQSREKNLGSFKIKQLQRPFVVRQNGELLRMTTSRVFPQPGERTHGGLGLAIPSPAAASPVMQSDSHGHTARQATEEEPSGVGNINKGPDHNHCTPKEPHRTFDGDFVDSDARMYSHFSPHIRTDTARASPVPERDTEEPCGMPEKH